MIVILRKIFLRRKAGSAGYGDEEQMMFRIYAGRTNGQAMDRFFKNKDLWVVSNASIDKKSSSIRDYLSTITLMRPPHKRLSAAVCPNCISAERMFFPKKRILDLIFPGKDV